MGVTLGKEGRVKVGGVTLAEMRSFRISETETAADRSTLEDKWDRIAGNTANWNASLTVWWDPTANGQTGLKRGDAPALIFYPQGTTAGKKYRQGDALVTSVEINVARDNHVEATVQVQGNGELQELTVGA